MVRTVDLKIISHVIILFFKKLKMYLEILGQYIAVLLQYAYHISQYIVIRFWHIVTALFISLESHASWKTKVDWPASQSLNPTASLLPQSSQFISHT